MRETGGLTIPPPSLRRSHASIVKVSLRQQGAMFDVSLCLLTFGALLDRSAAPASRISGALAKGLGNAVRVAACRVANI